MKPRYLAMTAARIYPEQNVDGMVPLPSSFNLWNLRNLRCRRGLFYHFRQNPPFPSPISKPSATGSVKCRGEDYLFQQRIETRNRVKPMSELHANDNRLF